MILPIGHEELSVRRLPWVTFSIIAACVVIFLATDTSQLGQASGSSERQNEAAAYWREHAYLEADPEIRERVAYDVMPNQRRQYLETLRTMAEPLRPHDPEELEAQQAELDRLTELALGLTQPDDAQQNAYQRWGFIPDAPRASALVTHAFLHGGWMHLIGNIFMLLLAGPAIEDRWGRALFGVTYLLSGVAGALVHMGLAHGSSLPLVGASGAIAGMLGAFLVRLWGTKIRFAYFFMFGFRPVWGTFEAAAWVMLPLWFGSELLQASFWSAAGVASGVANWAHVGGFAFGAAAALAMRAFKIEERFIDPAIEASITHYSANPVLEEAMAARESGDVGRAFELLQAEWKRKPDDDLALAFWDAAVACAQPELAAPALVAAVRSAVRRNEFDVALRHWSTLASEAPKTLVDPGTLLRLVPVLVAENQKDQATLALRQAVDPANRGLVGGLAMRAAELAREIHPPSALLAARAALASPDLHPAKREKIEALIAELAAQVAAAAPEPAAEPGSDLAADADRLIGDELTGNGLSADALSAEIGAGPPPVPGAAAEPELDLDDFPLDEEALATSRFARAKLGEARPTRLEGELLHLALEDGREGGLRLDKVQAVAAAIIAGLAAKPVLVIDLLVNWNEAEAEELRGVRLRSDRCDPRKLVPSDGSPQQAFGALIEKLLEASSGVALPDGQAAVGKPFSRFESLADYQRDVLGVTES
jgi:membrane associated rhomboid family serine protease